MAELPSFHAVEAEVFHQTSGATIQLPATGTPSPRSPFMANGYLDVLTFALTWWDGPLAHDLLERMFLQWGKSGCGKAEIGMVADRMLSLLEVPDRGECITQITRLSALKIWRSAVATSRSSPVPMQPGKPIPFRCSP